MNHWFDNYTKLSVNAFLRRLNEERSGWIVKRLSGNDTGLTEAHQAGVYFPRWFFKVAVPEICTTEKHNPDAYIDSVYMPGFDKEVQGLRAIYYNSKYFPELGLKKKYDEFRITRWEGSSNPLQQPDNTGALVVFAFRKEAGKRHWLVWLAKDDAEEEVIERWIGSEVMPGEFHAPVSFPTDPPPVDIYDLAKKSIPDLWIKKLPSGKDIFKKIVELLPHDKWKGSVDDLLLKRRSLEYAMFREMEQRSALPQISKGFSSVEDMLKVAHTISNRRKSRTGRSLELNLAAIFRDDALLFEEQAQTEANKTPDFLFPSAKAYQTPTFPAEYLHMLASKTCCRERWTQVIDEADRISPKHLFTLQEGISAKQLQKMAASSVILVVPQPNISKFPEQWRKNLLHLQGFVDTIKDSQQKAGLRK